MRQKILAAAVLMTMTGTSQAAGIPVFDATQSIHFVSSLKNQATQIYALQQQVKHWETNLKNMTGTRGMGVLAQIGISKTLPELSGVLRSVQNGNGAYDAIMREVMKQSTVLTDQAIAKLPPEQRDVLVRLRNLGAMRQMMANNTTALAGAQLGEIQSLIAQIDQAQDPKAIADLTAAISAKKLELDNTRLKLYAMEQQAAAEQNAIELKRQEIARARMGGSERATIRLY